jgi:Family of unknown function (DUF6328)
MTDEEQREKHDLDRELIEFLNELRVTLPGVQVLFAFLLIVPFSNGWDDVTDVQRYTYFTAFICTAVSTALLIAPSTYHRLRWREGDREYMLVTSNRLAIMGSAFLAGGLTATVFLIADVLFGNAWAAVVAALVGVLFVGLWFGLALFRDQTDRRRS